MLVAIVVGFTNTTPINLLVTQNDYIFHSGVVGFGETHGNVFQYKSAAKSFSHINHV